MSSIQKNYNSSFDLNRFFKDIKLKKQYIKQLKNKVILLNKLKEKNYKNLNSVLLYGNSELLIKTDFLVAYIIAITFLKTNTFVHVMDFSGHLKFFCSAGSLQYKGKGKKARFSVVKKMYKTLILTFKFLQNQPIALHLKNVGFAKSGLIKLLKKKFFIKVIRNFNVYPHNGCRKKKMRRK